MRIAATYTFLVMLRYKYSLPSLFDTKRLILKIVDIAAPTITAKLRELYLGRTLAHHANMTPHANHLTLITSR
jgi:hypothetical protein